MWSDVVHFFVDSLTLYRGLKPTLQSLCASNFVYFYTFHGLKRLKSPEDSSALSDLLFGSIAGVVNVLTTTPLWVVNTRVKMQGIRNEEFRNPQHFNGLLGEREFYIWKLSLVKNIENVLDFSFVDGLCKIYKSSGLLALWSGTLPSLMLVINPAIQYMTYESLKRRLSHRQLSSLGYFVIACIAKAIATVLTYPLQIIQTKMRVSFVFRNLLA